ncbi:MAG: glycosyltransferase family 2 protein, partial [Sphingomonadales bacterium]|nr:glycosyltransferase family 2 protein [Sphingomonadales bacterium]
RLAVEFLDAEGGTIARADGEYTADDTEVGGSLSAVAPEGTAAIACHVEIRLPDGEAAEEAEEEPAVVRLSDPSLCAESDENRAAWVPGTIDDSAFRRSAADSECRIFFADRQLDLPLDAEGAIEVYRDRAGRPVLSGPEAASATVEYWPIRGDLLEIRIAGFGGPLLLAIDGAVHGAKWVVPSTRPLPVTFRIPRALLDGEYHVLHLLDGRGLAILGSDFAHLGDQATDWSSLRDGAMPPYPAHLSPKAARRMEAMRRQLAWFGGRDTLSEDDRWLLANLHRIEQTLTAGFERNRDVFALRFPEAKQPTVSIVIPVHGQYAATFHCLCSLLFARNDTSFEVIVVDDGSPDETAAELARHEGIRIVSRAESDGFIAACNDGAAQAKGEYILFLNNDCEVTPGWLDELVASFAFFPGAGAACPQLLHSDGRLQTAGTIVWSNGKPQNVGWNRNPRDPRYGYSRDTDYLAGAALITLRSLWDEIGGFETELSPAYFEDTWYSFAVREAGYRTIYCATSTVYHTRGVSNGLDPDSETSVKRFQTINHPKFKRRWHQAYKQHGDYDGDAMLEKDRTAKKRVLMIGWRVPRPDQDAGSYSTLREMAMLRDLGCKLTFLPTNLEYAGRYSEALQRRGVECLHAPFAMSVKDFLAERGGEFDLVLVSRYTILRPHIRAIRELAPRARLVLNVEDLNFVREMRRAIAGGDSAAEEKVHAVREEELRVIRNADLVLSYSDIEVALLDALVGSRPKIEKMPWVEEPRPGGAPFGERNGLCFLGSHQHPPNAEAVEAFAREIAPALGEDGPALHVYGAHWPDEGPTEDGSVVIEGFAPDIAETFDRHRIFVAPLKSGAG